MKRPKLSLFLMILVIPMLFMGCQKTTDNSNTIKATQNSTKSSTEPEIVDKVTPIQELLAKKNNKKTTEVKLHISRETDTHARGSVSFYPYGADDSGYFLAAMRDGNWEIIFDGNGSYQCEDVKEYDFPADMISDCTGDEDVSNPAEVTDPLAIQANLAISAIAEKNMSDLAELVHPKKGVSFSPYTNIKPEVDQNFSKEELVDIFSSEDEYIWGNYDGSGEEIKLTFAAYYDQFIYNRDFLKAGKVGYNEILGTGNMINNISTVYPDASVVEYHFSGSDPAYDGLDWNSLKLVFEDYEGEWVLTYVVHDGWTI